MIYEKMLISCQNKEFEELKEYMISKFNASVIPMPLESEWIDFENLYFELKDFISFKSNIDDKFNSLSDLSFTIWHFKLMSKEDRNEGLLFVTENLSILNLKDKILQKYGVEIKSIVELENGYENNC